MKAIFVEMPPFQRFRQNYLDDDGFRALQLLLLQNPEAGDVIAGTGGLRKIRFADSRRSKGKRGGSAGDLVLVARWPSILAVYALRQR